MILVDKNIDEVTVGELREDFAKKCKCITNDNGFVKVGNDGLIPLNFKDLSDLGLLYKINKEVLHPLGIALTRTSDVSLGAVVALDGKPIVYDEEVTTRRELDLTKLSDRLNRLRNHFDDEPVAQAPHPGITLGEVITLNQSAPLSFLDRINMEKVNFSNFPTFYDITTKLSFGTARNIIKRNYDRKRNFPDKYIKTLPSNIDELSGLIAYLVYIFEENFDFITFEGIDATGKQTISNILKDYLEDLREIKNTLRSLYTKDAKTIPDYNPSFNDVEFLNENPHSSINIEIHKQNIPDYDITSGKEILNILHTNPGSGALKYLFGLNRYEVQDRYKKSASRKHYTNVRIYDRYVESSIAFTLAKEIIKERKNNFIPRNHFFSYDAANITIADSGMIDRNKLERDTVRGIEYFEYDQLKLDKPKVMVLCYANIETIKARLEERSKHIPLDKHETDLELLHTTQYVYHKLSNTRSKNNEHLVIKLDTGIMNQDECVIKILQTLIDKTNEILLQR